MSPTIVVLIEPGIEIFLELLDRPVYLLPERDPVELIECRLVEPFTDSIGLRTLGFRPGVIDVVQRQVELVLVPLDVSAVLSAAIRQDPAQSSSIILTTVTDVVGFFSFLGIATLLASYLPG